MTESIATYYLVECLGGGETMGVGIYVITDLEGFTVYVGITEDNLGDRIRQHVFEQDALGIEIGRAFPQSIDWRVEFIMPDPDLSTFYHLQNREYELIKELKPTINSNGRCYGKN